MKETKTLFFLPRMSEAIEVPVVALDGRVAPVRISSETLTTGVGWSKSKTARKAAFLDAVVGAMGEMARGKEFCLHCGYEDHVDSWYVVESVPMEQRNRSFMDHARVTSASKDPRLADAQVVPSTLQSFTNTGVRGAFLHRGDARTLEDESWRPVKDFWVQGKDGKKVLIRGKGGAQVLE